MHFAARVKLFLAVSILAGANFAHSATEDLIDVESATESPEATNPVWDGKSSDKGFLSEDEEGNYYYKTAEDDGSVEVKKEEESYEPSQAAKEGGLVSVLKDGSHLYKVEESEKDGGFSFRFGSLSAPNFKGTSGVSFSDIYGDKPLFSFLLDYEWHLTEKAGQLGFMIGTGFSTSSGNGRFSTDIATEAEERYTLYIFLNHLSLVYRMQFSDHPWIVPYVSGGFMPVGLLETRDDNITPKAVSAMAAHGSGGIKFNLSRLDYESQFNLDSEYGINNLWFDIEFKTIQGLSKTRDLTSTLMSAGVGFDY